MKNTNESAKWNVGFSAEAKKELSRAKITVGDARELIDMIISVPKTQFEIDSCDGIAYKNIPLSWIRNWIDKTVIIITREEAKRLDAVA